MLTPLINYKCLNVRTDPAVQDDLLSFESWNLEFTTEIIDGLHDFCFFLRKVIERTDLHDLAKNTYPHASLSAANINQGSPYEIEVELCKKDLWWILGRVIHSTSVMVLGGDRSNVLCYKDGKTREYVDSRVYVEIESDLDRKVSKKHIIHIPSLVHCYVFSQLVNQVEDIVKKNTL